MEFFYRAPRRPSRLGILPGTFNPVTVAHVALARAALAHVDEVLLVLPRVFPHKDYSGASFADRIGMLREVALAEPGCSVAAADRGLFLDIAAECCDEYGPSVRLTFLCGRDAAERIAGWDYDTPGALEEMLRRFDLLVAARAGEYDPPAALRSAVRRLDLDPAVADVSATEVRQRAASGEAWEHLVPGAVREQVRRIYGGDLPIGRERGSTPEI